MNELRITTVQTHLSWENKAANLLHFDNLLDERISNTDVIILPEMFTTGFSMNPEKFAEDSTSGVAVDWMLKQAKRFDAVVTGSIIVEEAGNYYNRLLWVQPDGKMVHYDKRHRFSFAGEHKKYTAGQKRVLIEYKGWRILPLVCYDLRFPAWSRNTDDYDFCFYVANWPQKRAFAWKQLLVARAIENLSYVAGVNRCGADGNGIEHSGDSLVLHPSGKPLAALTPHETDVSTVVLKKDELREFRERFGFLNDRDDFEFKGFDNN